MKLGEIVKKFLLINKRLNFGVLHKIFIIIVQNLK